MQFFGLKDKRDKADEVDFPPSLIKKFASWLCHYDTRPESLSQRIAARLSSSQRDDHYLIMISTR